MEEFRNYNQEDVEVVAEQKVEGDFVFPVAKVIKGIGWLTIACGLIAGFTVGRDKYNDIIFEIAMLYWVAGIVSGMLLVGFGKVIDLLEGILESVKK